VRALGSSRVRGVHQLERGTRTAPLPANVRASCSARFFVGIPEIARRLKASELSV
jgi:hypothetical protein